MKSLCLRAHLNNKGMSLVPVLVASSIMVIVGLGIASMVKSTADVQAVIKIRDEADNAKIIAMAYLRDPDICKRSLLNNSGVKLSRIESNTGHKVNSIVSPSGHKVLSSGKSASGTTEMIFEPLNRDKKASEISSSIYMAQLRIRHEASGVVGGAVADRILPVQLVLSGDTAVNCQAVGSEGDTALVDTTNPHENPRNCTGGFLDVTDPKNKSTKVAGALHKELMSQFDVPLIDNNNQDLPSSNAYRYVASGEGEGNIVEYKGKRYKIVPTVIEGATVTNSTGWAPSGDRHMSKTISRQVCVNGRHVTIDKTTTGYDMPQGGNSD